MQLTVWYFRNCYTSQLLTNTSSNTHNSEHFYYPLRASNSLRIFTRNTIYLVKHQLLHQYNDIKSDLKRGYHWQVGVSKAFFIFWLYRYLTVHIGSDIRLFLYIYNFKLEAITPSNSNIVEGFILWINRVYPCIATPGDHVMDYM